MISLGESMEQDLMPFPDTMSWEEGDARRQLTSTLEKIVYYVGHTLQFTIKLLWIPAFVAFSAIRSLANRSIEWIRPSQPPEEPVAPSSVELASVLPPKVGVADSLFQTELLGTPYSATSAQGTCYWAPYLNKEHIEGNPDFHQFGIKILGNPAPFIKILKDLGSTAYRFSLEWAIIETSPGVFNQEGIALYTRFINELLKAGITPYVTIHHYNHPQWFEEMGGFHNFENTERFKNHALKMMELFPQVKNWYTFNEVGGFGLETLLGDFPGHIKGDHAAAGRLVRNVLIAHCKTYAAVKQKYGDSVELGITHQFLGFEPLKGNFIEKLVCRHFAKLSHQAVYNFFKTGTFSFQFPGMANIQFTIPKEEFEKHNRFLDVLGVQIYGNARFICGFNGGVPYPGPKVKNFCWGPFGFSAGVSCEDGRKVASFGPEIDTAPVKKALEDAFALGCKVQITEIGCDAKNQKRGEPMKIDRETQLQFFKDLGPVLAPFKDRLDALFVWTAYCSNGLDKPGQLEWNRGALTKLGIVEIAQGPNKEIADYELTPAAQFLREQILKMKAVAEGAGVASAA